MAIGITRPCECELGIDIKRLPEHLPGVFYVHFVKAFEELPAAQVIIVGIDMCARDSADRIAVLRGNGLHQGLRNTRGNLVLDGEHVFEILIEDLRPDVIAVAHVDQLRGDPQLALRFPHASLEYVPYSELAADFPHVARLGTELER